MPYELVDIVNDQDEVIGTIDRTPAWDKARPDMYRVVSILIERSDGTFLIQQRSLHKNKPLRFGMSVSGMPTSGMPVDAVAAKEMQEELGLSIPLAFLGKIKVFCEMGKLIGFSYLYKGQHDGPYTNWQEEAERLEYFTAEELNYMLKRFPYLFTDSLRAAWQFYQSNL